MIEPFDSYRFYQALKLHFEGKYDAIKYQFKTSANPQSFWKRKDKYFFAKIARRFNDTGDIINYYVAHFINDSKWVGDMLKHEDVYEEWLKKYESLGYRFEQDLYILNDLSESFDDLFTVDNGQHPVIVQQFLAGEIMLETLVVLDSMVGFVNRVDKEVTDTIVWPDVKLKIEKYKPFLKIDLDRFKKIVLKVFHS
jgi:T4 gene 59 helicase, N terminal./T4 gene 59 helicase, C terminal.